MIKVGLHRIALVCLGALILAPGVARAQPAGKAPAKTIALSAPAYRAILQKTRGELQSARPGAVAKIVQNLDAKYAVRRADGQIQSVSGNYWSKLGAELASNATVTPTQRGRARQMLEMQIRALDEWTKAPVYQPVDAAKIVAQLEASGQIRTGPLWWQKAISDAWAAVGRAWDRFTAWLSSLLPKAPAYQNTRAPSDKWLWGLFYVLVTAILAVLLYFAFRAWGGNLGWRKSKRVSLLENEDAELLQLPPEELLSRAERFAAQGNFREALRHRYLSLLLDLDARGVWRYDARRTNWEHIGALGRNPNGRQLVAPLSDLTKSFDRVRYGGAPCDDAGWRNFDTNARAFETLAAPKIGARETELVR